MKLIFFGGGGGLKNGPELIPGCAFEDASSFDVLPLSKKVRPICNMCINDCITVEWLKINDVLKLSKEKRQRIFIFMI